MTSDLNKRFVDWMAVHDDPENPAILAATVLVLRDRPDGPEVLMLQRNGRGEFANAWVFPGGKIDDEDHAPGPEDDVEASRRGAVREALEEADLVIDEAQLVPFSHWLPPRVMPRRFSTWFFIAEAPEGSDGDVTIDDGEIVDHLWVRPADALAKHAAGEVELFPPTWITLTTLAPFATAADAIAASADMPPPFFVTEQVSQQPMTVAWSGDEAWGDGSSAPVGGRNRLIMNPGGWTWERSG